MSQNERLGETVNKSGHSLSTKMPEELTVEEKYKDGDHYEAGKTILTIKCLF